VDSEPLQLDGGTTEQRIRVVLPCLKPEPNHAGIASEIPGALRLVMGLSWLLLGCVGLERLGRVRGAAGEVVAGAAPVVLLPKPFCPIG